MRRSRGMVVMGAGAAMLVAGLKVGAQAAADPFADDPMAVELAGGEASPSPDPSPQPSPAATATPAAASDTPATKETTKPATKPKPKAKPKGPTGTYKGPAVSTKYGTMQVAIVVKNGKIVDVKPLVVGRGDSTSRRINSNAVPTLEKRVLSKQTWKVSYVSGATYTSKGIIASVKGAMKKAGI